MNLSPFNFQGVQVRVVTDESGDPWFVAKDVCSLLRYANPSDAIGRHCKGVVKRYPLQTGGGMQEVRLLSEGDTLRLIINSTMPVAQQFESWVFDEVLPVIRRTGAYQRPMTQAELIAASANQLVVIERKQAEQEQALAQVEDRTSRLEQVRYLDTVPSGFETITTIRDRINHRHGLPAWVVNAVMREVSGAPLPFAMVRSRHAGEGGQPFAIWPKAAITRRFDQFVGQCSYVTAERATHPEIPQDRFKIKPRAAL
ncbi:BRO-N domain-containing protein [Pseudomonas mosselii]|uniref:Bro-N domain-containing protein n=1 Tax=Pseudomonas mosselii TaxID=78327 RepID=A0A7W2JUW9_9PSED|nr:BRO family protein [Pseudomonas mosselii]MBA6065531.1 hypothetical protein [Pseudomonas mosselii]